MKRIAVLLAVVLGALGSPGVAGAQTISICKGVTASVTLTRDVYCGNATDIPIGVPGQITTIILNLNGHSLTGSAVIGVQYGQWQYFGSSYTIENGQTDLCVSEGIGRATVLNMHFTGGCGVSGNGEMSGEAGLTIEHSTFDGGGIGAYKSSVSIIGNTFNAKGVDLNIAGGLIAHNRFNGIATAIGESLYSGSTLHIRSNTIVNGGTGIYVGFVGGDGGEPFITDNVIEGNSADGIEIDATNGGGKITAIRGNVSSHNGGDGIDLIYGSGVFVNTLTANTTDNNAGTGISAPADAPPDVQTIDGGGNEAHGNGVAQCVNITCAS